MKRTALALAALAPAAAATAPAPDAIARVDAAFADTGSSWFADDLRSALTQAKPAVWQAALAKLTAAPVPAARAIVGEALVHADANVVRSGIGALAAFGAPTREECTVLTGLLGHAQSGIRSAALHALGDAGDLKAAERMADLLADPDAKVVLAAQRALRQLAAGTDHGADAEAWRAWAVRANTDADRALQIAASVIDGSDAAAAAAALSSLRLCTDRRPEALALARALCDDERLGATARRTAQVLETGIDAPADGDGGSLLASGERSGVLPAGPTTQALVKTAGLTTGGKDAGGNAWWFFGAIAAVGGLVLVRLAQNRRVVACEVRKFTTRIIRKKPRMKVHY